MLQKLLRHFPPEPTPEAPELPLQPSLEPAAPAPQLARELAPEPAPELAPEVAPEPPLELGHGLVPAPEPAGGTVPICSAFTIIMAENPEASLLGEKYITILFFPINF